MNGHLRRELISGAAIIGVIGLALLMLLLIVRGHGEPPPFVTPTPEVLPSTPTVAATPTVFAPVSSIAPAFTPHPTMELPSATASPWTPSPTPSPTHQPTSAAPLIYPTPIPSQVGKG